MTIRVLLADDQALVRAGFRMILSAEPDIEVVGEADDGEATIAAVHRLQPDIVLMDIQMPVLDGLAATRRLVAEDGSTQTKVLILTTFERDDYIFEALQAGASGFLLKNAPPEELVHAVRVVGEGNALLAPSVTRRVIAAFAQHRSTVEQQSELQQLTEREVEVLRLLARGLTNAELAERLIVSEATVKTHVSHVLTKLDLRDRVQAVVFAYESGLVQPGTD